jgi:hypothetical protein
MSYIGHQYRHGDVLLECIEALPEGAKKEEGAIIAYGEVTGHSHRFAEPEAVELFKGLDDLTYVRVLKPTALIHEEHEVLAFQPGVYRYWQQREYTPQSIRRIAD